MGDAPGQSPNGFHFLGLHQFGLQFGLLFLCPLALGNVAHNRENANRLTGWIAQETKIAFHRDGTSILVDQL
jgi:hypothetical protein